MRIRPLLSATSIVGLAAVIIGVAGALSPAAALTGPSNYYECVIDRLAPTQNDLDATTARKTCRWDFPDFYWRRSVQRASGILAIFSPTAQQCVKKNTEKTGSRLAKAEIGEACRALYPPE